jgi:protein required for attachment to host cells
MLGGDRFQEQGFMQFPTGATIVVTDGRNLRLFRNSGDELNLHIEELAAPAMHAHHGAGRGPHGDKANDSPRSNAEDSHAAAVAEWLNQEAASGRLGALYIVAPPRTLGELRRHYHPTVKSRLIGEMNKEHTHDSLNVLTDLLAGA